jgi:hypothetical protein
MPGNLEAATIIPRTSVRSNRNSLSHKGFCSPADRHQAGVNGAEGGEANR